MTAALKAMTRKSKMLNFNTGFATNYINNLYPMPDFTQHIVSLMKIIYIRYGHHTLVYCSNSVRDLLPVVMIRTKLKDVKYIWLIIIKSSIRNFASW